MMNSILTVRTIVSLAAATAFISCGTPEVDCEIGEGSCPQGFFCSTKTGFGCGGAGSCLPIPEKCPYKFAFVCGCDGNSYPNVCNANMIGLTARRKGPCDVAWNFEQSGNTEPENLCRQTPADIGDHG